MSKINIASFNEFSELLWSAIKFNQKYRVHNTNKIPLAWYIHQHCCVRLGLGRGVGKTQFIINALELDENSVMVTDNKSFYHLRHRLGDGELDKNRYFTIENVIQDRVFKHPSPSPSPTTIYIDELTKKEVVLDIIDYFKNPSIEQTFVILGN